NKRMLATKTADDSSNDNVMFDDDDVSVNDESRSVDGLQLSHQSSSDRHTVLRNPLLDLYGSGGAMHDNSFNILRETIANPPTISNTDIFMTRHVLYTELRKIILALRIDEFDFEKLFNDNTRTIMCISDLIGIELSQVRKILNALHSKRGIQS